MSFESSIPVVRASRVVGFLTRWNTYQRERFPLLQHGPLIAVFGVSALGFSSLVAGRPALPSIASMMVAFISSLLFFLQLRIADEFKDHEEDCRFRPYRAVPRGLVSLGELRVLAFLTAVIQVALASWFCPRLLWLLGLAWAYLLLMTVEFFSREWLKARPFTYMWTHMGIMPLVDFYATAVEWAPHGPLPPRGLMWFLLASFFNGFVLEMGRKIRAPQDEEAGVPTYTALWGRKRAAWGWFAALLLTSTCAVLAAAEISFARPVLIGLLVGLVAAVALVLIFLRCPSRAVAKSFEIGAGVWILVMYLMLGIAPLVWRLFGGAA